MDIRKVSLSKKAEKDLRKLPQHIILKLAAWIEDVGERGLAEVRKIAGYHDEALKGKRRHQRSIRLSKHYRAIYEVADNKKIVFVNVLEVNKHEY
ncbi:MAG: type II toxin-antitoxin system RelE/ParE family toxin [Waddliaceae bacterium]